MNLEEKLGTIVNRFLPDGKISAIRPFGNGLINDSYLVESADSYHPEYILQRINHHIFRDVDQLQRNILAVTGHIRNKLLERNEPDIERKVLEFMVAGDGKSYYFDGESYWRVMKFIPDSVSYDSVTPEYAGYAGRAFGQFQYLLSDLPDELGETIPGFHNMELRLGQLRRAAAVDRAGRTKGVKDLLTELESRGDEMCKAERLYREGKLPKRVCHCDTKVDNILFDKKGGVLCVIDLDTVMPGFIFSDYGDFMRTAANTGAEDDRNLDNVNLDVAVFEAFTQGYLHTAGKFLTDIEVENLPYAAALFPYMQCVRFLADYLDGDSYYKIDYPGHNLIRAKAQFKLLRSMEENTPRMSAFIEKCTG
ncbi:MAG: aminoglycoside phosphotransferase family protein [Rikenellaceae bacterium]|nr:aminoglycoside phosphotransferase family protein [Rikenellaceae bacterium]